MAILIAIFSLFLSAYTFLVHDRKLKLQQKQLNDFQLVSLRTQEEEGKKALIRAEVGIKGRGNRVVHICNIGKAKATNLCVELANEDDVYATRPDLPWDIGDLLPHAHREIYLLLSEGDDEATFKFTWDDEYRKGNTEQQTITI